MSETKEVIAGTDQNSKSLSLSFKDYSDGKVPNAVFELFSLQTLSLSGDSLPTLPPLLSKLTSLTQLYLGNNQLKDLPDCLSSLKQLSMLELTGNLFEAFPNVLSELPSLRNLSIGRNKLSSLPSGPILTKFKSLEILLMTENKLSRIPPELGLIKTLKILSLSGNEQITELPNELSGLTSLEELLISRNSLNMVPRCVYGMKSLSKLDLSCNSIRRFSEPLSEICGMINLTNLNIASNELEELPDQITHLPKLEVIEASANKINHLPSDFSSLSGTLIALILRSNRISVLPESIFSLTKLSTLDLGYNDLVSMPTKEAISKLPSLKNLIIFGNSFNLTTTITTSETPNGTTTNSLNLTTYTQEPDPPAEIVNKLFLGSYTSAQNRHGLHNHGITHILTVAQFLKPLFPQDFVYHIVHIEDTDDADLASCFESCIEFIENALLNGGGVLVHCVAGISRSASVVAAYLIAKKKMSANEALNLIKQKRPIVCPNLGFVAQLEQFEHKLRRKSGCKHQ